MSQLISVNVGKARPAGYASAGRTAIGKRPVPDRVLVIAPGPKGEAGSGLAGDEIGDKRHHGGDDQAVYAYAREDLDGWAAELGRNLPCGAFGENLTTRGIDVTGARIGERWQVGADVVLEVATARIPCRTFAGWLGQTGWVRRFIEYGAPGAYLRVLAPGHVAAGDPVQVIHRPQHEVTVGLTLRALTVEPDLLKQLIGVAGLHPEGAELARRRTPIAVDPA